MLVAPVLLAPVLLATVLLATGAHAQDFERIERGRYLATVGDCVACHTVPGGGTPFAGGRPLVTPFGTLVTPNLTPDDETGLGAWTEAQFVDAVQNGIGRQGEHLYPGLPYPYFTQATRADLADIFAYLRTLDAVRNPVVSNQLPFPFDIRAGLVAWNAINFRPGEYRPDATKGAEWNRGGYLVQGLGHCGACHSPKGLTGGDQTSRAWQGGLLQGWYAPNITGDADRGIGAWSLDDIVEYLKTGTSHLAVAEGPMAEVISYSTTHMSDADLHAVALYLKDQPGQSSRPAPVSPDTPAMHAGAAIYADQCSACHAPHGEGVRNLIPALAGAPALQNDRDRPAPDLPGDAQLRPRAERRAAGRDRHLRAQQLRQCRARGNRPRRARAAGNPGPRQGLTRLGLSRNVHADGVGDR